MSRRRRAALAALSVATVALAWLGLDEAAVNGLDIAVLVLATLVLFVAFPPGGEPTR
jgi:hypothetical protein